MKPWENKAVAFGIAGVGAFVFLIAILHHKHEPVIKPTPPSQNVNRIPASQGMANNHNLNNSVTSNIPSPQVASTTNSPSLNEPANTQEEASSQNTNQGNTQKETQDKQVKSSEHTKSEKTKKETHNTHHRRERKVKHKEQHRRKHHEEQKQEYNYSKKVIPDTVINQLANGNIACSANGCTLILSNGENIKPMQIYHGYLIKSITLSHITVQDSKGNTRRINVN